MLNRFFVGLQNNDYFALTDAVDLLDILVDIASDDVNEVSVGGIFNPTYNKIVLKIKIPKTYKDSSLVPKNFKELIYKETRSTLHHEILHKNQHSGTKGSLSVSGFKDLTALTDLQKILTPEEMIKCKQKIFNFFGKHEIEAYARQAYFDAKKTKQPPFYYLKERIDVIWFHFEKLGIDINRIDDLTRLWGSLIEDYYRRYLNKTQL